MKKCFKCGQIKPLDKFYKHSQMGDGHLGKCKECTKDDAHKARSDNIGYYRDYDIKRSKLPHRKSLGRSNTIKYRADHPYAYKAHCAVNNAVRDGRLIKPISCSRCGRSDKVIHGHHRDYAKPLDVEWLCSICHSAEKCVQKPVEDPYCESIFIQMELFEPRASYGYSTQ